jgi:hypothetical protein
MSSGVDTVVYEKMAPEGGQVRDNTRLSPEDYCNEKEQC